MNIYDINIFMEYIELPYCRLGEIEDIYILSDNLKEQYNINENCENEIRYSESWSISYESSSKDKNDDSSISNNRYFHDEEDLITKFISSD